MVQPHTDGGDDFQTCERGAGVMEENFIALYGNKGSIVPLREAANKVSGGWMTSLRKNPRILLLAQQGLGQ